MAPWARRWPGVPPTFLLGVLCAVGALFPTTRASATDGDIPQAASHVVRLAIPPGRELAARRLLADVGFMEELPGGYVLSSITLEQQTVTIVLRASSDLPEGPAAGRIVLVPRALARPGEIRSRNFAIRLEPVAKEAVILPLLRRAQDSIVAHDTADFYVERDDVVESRGRALPVSMPRPLAQSLTITWQRLQDWEMAGTLLALRHLTLAGLVLLVWALLLLVAIPFRPRDYGIELRVRATHLIPAGIQLVLFVYWGLYWPGVGEQALLIGLQLVFAYGFDILLGLTMGRRWVLSYGPIPIVLSANLFVWFPADHFYLSVVVVAVALASRSFLRRAGRHIFNPSALGIAVVGAFCIAFPDRYPYVDIAHELNLPPNMLELMFLLALLPQSRIPIVLVSIAAVITTYAMTMFHPAIRPTPLWSPVFLALVLLATDPATIPRTGMGKLLFGCVLGLVTSSVSTVLELNGISDFYGKVLAIPVANLLVPWFDGVASRVPPWLSDSLAPARNRAHVGVWMALVLIWLHTGVIKEGGFESKLHARLDTPHVVLRDGSATCEDNPMYCTPFTFLSEAKAWMR